MIFPKNFSDLSFAYFSLLSESQLSTGRLNKQKSVSTYPILYTFFGYFNSTIYPFNGSKYRTYVSNSEIPL